VIKAVNETKSILDTILRRKHRHGSLLKNILEGKIIGKSERERNGLNILSDLVEIPKYVALKNS